ncbi:hypothetical protein [Bremerella cremea]|uniref:hypothetical protein n=1 Tax=Bremerella cremea TaxID=1031537 RepID=UPI0031E961C7
MPRLLLAASFTFGLLIFSHGLFADEPAAEAPLTETEKQLQNDVQTLTTALLEADSETALKLLHPKPFDRRIGSREEFTKGLKKAKEALGRIKLFKPEISVAFPKRPIFVEGEQHQFAIVPIETQVKMLGGIGKSESFLIGIREEKDDTWRYLDGTKLEQEDIQKLFSDFPVEQPLPLVKNSTQIKEEEFESLLPKMPTPPEDLKLPK